MKQDQTCLVSVSPDCVSFESITMNKIVIPKIVKSRMRLRKFAIVDYPEDDRQVFFITPTELYPDLFALRFPELVQKSRQKRWELTKHGNSSYLSFEQNILSEEDLGMVREWRERFSQYILIGLNQNIDTEFSDELDFCVALDYTFTCKEEIPAKRTIYGEAVYQLKNKRKIYVLDILSNGLAKALKELGTTFQIRDPVLSIIPSRSDQCSVPRKLAKAVSRETGIPFIDCILHADKSELKNLALTDKSPEWNQIYSLPDCIQWMGDFANKTVFLIDDLYQSGTTLWHCAKNLKERGAANVIGLVCVKTLKDTDNQ